MEFSPQEKGEVDTSPTLPQLNWSGTHGSQTQMLHPSLWWLSPEALLCTPICSPGCSSRQQSGFVAWQREGDFAPCKVRHSQVS